MKARRFYVITGGTMVHVAPHFSLCAPAYGSVGRQIYDELSNALVVHQNQAETPLEERAVVVLVRTKMALGNQEPSVQERDLFRAAGLKFLETNEDLETLLDHLVLQPETKCIILAAAVCDWAPTGQIELTGGETLYDLYKVDEIPELGKRHPRLQTKWGPITMRLSPADKIIGKIRRTRKDLFLVGFKATTGLSEQEQYITGLGLLKGASCNLVLANDVHEHRNMVITPEEAKYHVTKDRKKAIHGLCGMIAMRSQLHFTRSTVVDGDPVPWDSDAVPENLRKVVNYCIERGAYKPFQGKTVGHFATRGPKPGIIYTSRRKSNFNELARDGLLRIDTVGEDQVIAYGAKPSVGGQSQRIIFDDHPDVDCIVHFHCPMRSPEDPVRQRGNVPLLDQWACGSVHQRPYECGSHECGQNTSTGLVAILPGVKAVMLEEHGPNICFSRDTDPELVIRYIETYWDLDAKTGGPVSLEAPS